MLNLHRPVDDPVYVAERDISGLQTTTVIADVHYSR
jgi:hypothetical protein